MSLPRNHIEAVSARVRHNVMLEKALAGTFSMPDESRHLRKVTNMIDFGSLVGSGAGEGHFTI